ncbi:hypothetical protein QD357_30930, partial [Rhizobium sp. BR 317]|uniref:hypothetical protein n=1 Tax=Rhizobium sp. BR 317 TaxID=3040015 RepID=UPI0039BF7808
VVHVRPEQVQAQHSAVGWRPRQSHRDSIGFKPKGNPGAAKNPKLRFLYLSTVPKAAAPHVGVNANCYCAMQHIHSCVTQ